MENKKRIIVFTFFGIIFIILGILFLVLSPGVISRMVHQKVSILPQNPGFKLWRDLDIPIFQNFHMFNIKNPDAMRSGAKPIVEDIGPFVFKARIFKHELKFNEINTQVSFLEQKEFYFQPNLSVHDLSKTITTINVPLLTVLKTIKTIKIPPKIIKVILFVWNWLKFDIFITGTVEELLFKGQYNSVQWLIHKLLPGRVPDDQFCLMKNQNSSITGPYQIYTGHPDISLLNTFLLFNGSNRLDFWSGDECNDITGSSNGELFPPADRFGGIKEYRFFRPDFCREFILTLNQTNVPTEVGSIRADRFRPDSNSFKNASQYPPNACYRPKEQATFNMDEQVQEETIRSILEYFNISKSDFEHYLKNNNSSHNTDQFEYFPYEKPSGVFDVSPCQQDAPIYLSYPHFFEADEYFLKQIDGLNPNASKHQSYIDIEPKTGTPVDFLARIQANVDLQTSGSREPNMRSLMFPVFWQEFSIHVTKQIADQIESQTKTPVITADTISLLILIIGFIMFAYALVVFCIHWKQQRRRESMLSNALSDSNDPLLNGNNINGTTTVDTYGSTATSPPSETKNKDDDNENES